MGFKEILSVLMTILWIIYVIVLIFKTLKRK